MPVRQPPRVPLARLPTPLVRADWLARQLGGAQLWIKRDDLTGLELSGNKVRKLEYIVAGALEAGCDTLITEGTPQSNHCRTTAAVCARLGLGCHLLLRPPPPAGPPLGNHLMSQLFGARMSCFERQRFEREHDLIVARVLRDEEAAGRKPRFIPMGAAEPLGCWGYIRAAAELAEQLQRAGVGECDIVVATSSGSTLAGLVLGKLAYRLDHWKLWGIPVSEDVLHHAANLERLCRATIEQYDLPVRYDPNAAELMQGYVGAGYGVPSKRSVDCLLELARCEAILLDPVYTAKAFLAVVDGIQAGRFGRQRPVVFIHTGGIFSDFAWPKLLAGGAARRKEAT